MYGWCYHARRTLKHCGTNLHSQQYELIKGCQTLPPVHLLHQVCTYQKACPIEAMRAVNTFGEKKRGSTEVKNSDFNHFIFTFILFAMGEYAQSHKSCQSIFRPMYAQRLHIINLM